MSALSEIPIPEAWKLKVSAILRQNAPSTIIVTRRAQLDWLSLFPNELPSHLRETLMKSLSQPGLRGERRFMDEPGTCYQWLFSHCNVPLYAKLSLLDSNVVVVVYSAHRQLK